MADEPTADPLEHYEYMPCSHALSSQGWICRECAKRWAWNQLRAAEREVAALRGEVGRLREACQNAIEVMDIQEKRETEEFHLSAGAFRPMWDRAKQELGTALEASEVLCQGDR